MAIHPVVPTTIPAHRPARAPLSTRNALRGEHGRHDEINSVVDLKAVSEDRTFEILREQPW
jgi:hypothetical protein